MCPGGRREAQIRPPTPVLLSTELSPPPPPLDKDVVTGDMYGEGGYRGAGRENSARWDGGEAVGSTHIINSAEEEAELEAVVVVAGKGSWRLGLGSCCCGGD